MLISFQPIKGETPALSAKKLPNDNASRAVDCDFDAHNLKPIHGMSSVKAVGSNTETVYKHGSSWLEWPGHVDVVRSFVTDSGGRIAFTGNGYPKETNTALAGAERRLGIDAPTNALAITLSGTPGEDVVRTASYVYTRIGTWEDGSVVESAPSNPSAPIDIKEGIAVTLTGFQNSALPGVFTTGYRLYRLNSGTSGAEYQFLADISIFADHFEDTISDSNIGSDILSTTLWTNPIDTLTGIISTTHGFLAGFSGNKVYFSEVYTPYAFPDKYALPTDSDVVAIGFNGSSVVALTKTYPYLFVGQDPATLSPIQINYEQACVSARSVVNVLNGVIYATPDGLFFLDSAGQGNLLTDAIFTRDQWEALSPENIFAFRYNDSYLAFFKGGTEGIEFKIGANTLKRFSTTRAVYGGFYVADEDTLYLIRDNGLGGRQLDSLDTNSALTDYDWWSKTFLYTSSITLSVALIQGDFTAGSVILRVYCDGVLSATATVSSDALILWPPVRCNEVMIKLSGKTTIENVLIASSAMEIYHG